MRSAVRLAFCSTVLIFVVLPLALDIIVRRELRSSARRAGSPYSRLGVDSDSTVELPLASCSNFFYLSMNLVETSKILCSFEDVVQFVLKLVVRWSPVD